MRARCHPAIGDEPRLAYNRVLLKSHHRLHEPDIMRRIEGVSIKAAA
jgi:hypothetical protein